MSNSYKKRKTWLIKVLFCAGVIILIFGVMVIIKASECKTWVSTEGTIIGSSLQELPIPEKKSHDTLSPDIVYEYQVPNGRIYFSNRISSLDNEIFPRISENYYAGTYEELRKYLSKYQVGTKVPVYYNPQKPSESVIDNGLKAPVFIPLTLGIAILYYAFHLHAFGRLRSKNEEAS